MKERKKSTQFTPGKGVLIPTLVDEIQKTKEPINRAGPTNLVTVTQQGKQLL